MKEILIAGSRFFLWLVSLLPGLCLKWYYSEKKLCELINIDVQPRGDQLTFDCGKPPRLEMHMRITNFSTLPIKMTHLNIEIWGIGNNLKMQSSEPVTTANNTYKDYIFHGLEGVDLLDILESANPGMNLRLVIKANIECKVRNFTININDIQGVHINIQNCNNELRKKFIR